LIKKEILKKKQPIYKLTPKGLAIYPILLALIEWGDKCSATEEGPPLYLTHKTCGSAKRSNSLLRVLREYYHEGYRI